MQDFMCTEQRGGKSLPAVYWLCSCLKSLGCWWLSLLPASIQGHNPQVLFSKLLPGQLVPSLNCCKGFSIASAGLCICPFQIS